MRLLFFIISQLLLLPLTFSQSVNVQHQLQPNTSYEWTLEKNMFSESERIGSLYRNGVERSENSYSTRKVQTFMKARMITAELQDERLYFAISVDSFYHSSEFRNLHVDNDFAGAQNMSNVIIHGHRNSWQRMMIDSIKGTANQFQYDQLFTILEELYRIRQLPKAGLEINQPLKKSSKTEMLRSASAYTLTDLTDDVATINFTDNRYGTKSNSRNSNKDSTEIAGSILFNQALGIIEKYQFKKVFILHVEHNLNDVIDTTASGVSNMESTQTTDYKWTFKELTPDE